LRIRIRGLFDPWIRDPGWVKNQDPDPDPGPGSGMKLPGPYFRELRNHFFGLKYLNSLLQIQYPENSDSGSVIRDGKISDPG
jgi:hypothetical protein